jgi:hypothetical protein
VISRARAVPLDESVAVTVAAGYLIYSQELGRQVGGGETVLIHPGNVESWTRNGWVEQPGTDTGQTDVEIVETAETSEKPRRRARTK